MQQVKNTVRLALANAHYLAGRRAESLKGAVVILAYHRVLPQDELDGCYVQRGMYVDPRVFDLQMSFLKKNFKVIGFSEFLNMLEKKDFDYSQRYCVITFDDGWLDNYIYAYPILRKHNLPATIFLTTSLIGTNRWFWPEKLSYLLLKCFSGKPAAFLYRKWPWIRNDRSASIDDRIDSAIESVKLLPENEISNIIENATSVFGLTYPDERMLLNWDEVAEMSENNISFGSHTATHAILTKLTPAQADMELRDSLNTLREQKIDHLPVLSYPNGNYTHEIAALAAAAGYVAAVTIERGHEDVPLQNLFELKRIGVHNDISKTVPLFSYRISGTH